MLVLALILQNFDLELWDPKYVPVIKQTLTIKPDNLYIRATLRKGRDISHLGGSPAATKEQTPVNGAHTNGTNGTGTKPMTVLYGSNTGTCQALAQKVSAAASSRGFHVDVKTMDSATNDLPKDHPVIVITSSYEGQPPDNAAKFVAWLKSLRPGSLSGVEYTVFGCGHRDWSSTFHRIPLMTENLLRNAGATCFAPTGLADASKGNMYGEFEDWLDNVLWKNLSCAEDVQEDTVSAEISTGTRATDLRYDVHPATVKENYRLTAEGEPAKYHMEIELPPDTIYHCGDYLAILPLNSEARVKQVMARFSLPDDAIITMKGSGTSSIPANTALSVAEVLRGYVELGQPATKKDLKKLAVLSNDAKDKAYLENLSNEDTRFDIEIGKKRTSAFDLLQKFPSITMPFPQFLSLLPPLHVRQYSISSSPLVTPGTCSITYGVIDTAALSDPQQRFEGVTGAYLKSLQAGSSILVSVRQSAKKTFCLPVDPEQTPLLMFAAGTGLAPFRGFLQERALQIESGRQLAPAILFLGCRAPTKDRLYAEQLDKWTLEGVVDVRYSFSKAADLSEGCAYVPERMLHDAEDVVTHWRNGARVYVCGTRNLANGIREAATKIALTVRDREGKSEAEAAEVEQRFREMLQTRVASDVFD
jgi:cytochrome P450 / NADPH-cytochrome P450 reductase